MNVESLFKLVYVSFLRTPFKSCHCHWHPTDKYISMITRRSSCSVLNQCCIGVIVPLISTSMCVIILEYTVDEAPVLEWWTLLFYHYAPKRTFRVKTVAWFIVKALSFYYNWIPNFYLLNASGLDSLKPVVQ